MESVMHAIFGCLFLATGLSLSTVITFRLYTMWSSLLVNQRTFFIAFAIVAFGFTQRGIELLFFDVPGPRPAAYLTVLGGLVALWSLLQPVDTRIVGDVAIAKKLAEKEPDVYAKYVDILNKSAENRNTPTPSADRYKTHFEE